jgi:hypothetical protein
MCKSKKQPNKSEGRETNHKFLGIERFGCKGWPWKNKKGQSSLVKPSGNNHHIRSIKFIIRGVEVWVVH